MEIQKCKHGGEDLSFVMLFFCLVHWRLAIILFVTH